MESTILTVVKNYTTDTTLANNLTYWLLKKYKGLNKTEFSKLGIKVPNEKAPSKNALKWLTTIEANHAHLFFA